jgi:hypothetical protein
VSLKHLKVADSAAAAASRGTWPEEQKLHTLLSIWRLEMVCCVLFTGSLIAIIMIVWIYGNRPLPVWPYHLIINSLISIYVVVIKASLLFVTAQCIGRLKWRWFEQERPLTNLMKFDDASRGASGSLPLLWTLKGRNVIASCGAFINIAALLVDPFVQQVISSYQCMHAVQDSRATISRTNYFFDE